MFVNLVLPFLPGSDPAVMPGGDNALALQQGKVF